MEKQFWKKTREALQEFPDAFLLRIENSVYPGTPDFFYMIDKICGFVELKQLSTYPVRETTVVRIDHFTHQQRCFLHDYHMSGGRCFLWLRVGKDYYLFDGLQAAMDLGRNWTKADLKKNALVSWIGEPIDWDRFVKELKI